MAPRSAVFMAQVVDQSDGAAEAPEVLLAVALIGVLGIALGGIIQLISQRWVVMYDRMFGLRLKAGALSRNTILYATLLAQIAAAWDKARLIYDVEGPINEESAEENRKYITKLSTEAFATYQHIQADAIDVMSSGDFRLSEFASKLLNRAIKAKDEVSLASDGQIIVGIDRAGVLGSDLAEHANVLLNMIAPRKWERYSRFRSEESARKELAAWRITREGK